MMRLFSYGIRTNVLPRLAQGCQTFILEMPLRFPVSPGSGESLKGPRGPVDPNGAPIVRGWSHVLRQRLALVTAGFWKIPLVLSFLFFSFL